MSLTAYLYARQYIPFERMSEMFHDIFRLPVSIGTLVNLVNTFSTKSAKIYEKIREKITNMKKSEKR
jgi:hypothetical protein